MKLKTRKNRRVPRNNNEQAEPLINHNGEIGTLAQDVKMIYSVIPKNIRELENYNKFRNSTKCYFCDIALTRCMYTELLQ